MTLLRREKRNDRFWFRAKHNSEIRFLPLWIGAGKVLRFLYRLRHWDWSDWTPEPTPPLAKAVAGFGAPVYGLVDQFMNLQPGGRAYSSDEIELHYSTHLGGDEKSVGVEIASVRMPPGPDPDFVKEMHARMSAYSAAFNFSSLEFRVREMNKDRTSPTDFLTDYPETKVQDIRLQVAEFAEPAGVWRWDVPEPVYVVMLTNAEVRLRVSTFDLSAEQLVELVRYIRRIDDRPDVIEEYDRRAYERWDAYEQRLMETHTTES